MSNKVYSVDTSALIDGLERYYPEAVFPKLWELLEDLVNAGRFIVSEEVYLEATHNALAAKAWCEPRKQKIVVATDNSVAKAVTRVLTACPKLVKAGSTRNRADPFVIAIALLRQCAVITGERPTGSPSKPKIPDACSLLNIECGPLLNLIRAEGWTF